MLALFCLRLAAGMVAALCLFSPRLVNPRFYKVHFLIALGLGGAAFASFRARPSPELIGCLGVAMLLAFLGSAAWSLEGAPWGRSLIGLTALTLLTALGLAAWQQSGEISPARLIAEEYSSSALLGAATTAMLMGHSYLIAPSMSLVPLLRLIGALFGTLLLRGLICGIHAWHSIPFGSNLTEEMVLLPVRWAVGFLLPLILAIMSWKTARIRATQSATGILYVVVVLVFLGELIEVLT